MLTRSISNTRKSNQWSLYASKTIGSLRLIALTKYLSIACLSLALISATGLNLYRTYSSSNTLSNAEEVGSNSNNELSTLANDSSVCDPTNTNAAACISLSITSSSSSSTGGNDANLSLSIPQGGGIAAGRHTVEVSSNNVTGYYVSLNAKSDTTDLVNTNDDGTVNKDHVITSLPVENDFLHPTVLSNNTWGVALPGQTKLDCVNSDNCSGTRLGNSSESDDSDDSDDDDNPPDLSEHYEYWFSPDYYYDDEDYFDQVLFASIPPRAGFTTNVISTQNQPSQYNRNIYYGVRVDNPNELLAGNYQAEVVYTATTNEVPVPTIDTLNQNSYELGSGTNLDSNNRLPITITGTNLKSTYRVYLVSNADSTKQYDITKENITNISNTELKITLPTDITNSELEAGDYTIHVVTQGGEDTIGFTYTEKPKPVGTVCTNADSQSACQVDIDVNMIPIRYDGNNSDGSARWLTVSNDEVNNNKGIWYNYEAKQWANAVTVEADKLSTYQNKSGVEVNNDDVLGYWVYIPRYAYKVMRKEVTDKVVTDEEAKAMGGFDIRFETNEDFKRTPKSCSTSSSSRYYQDCVDTTYPTEERLANQTAWATHPAFSWGSKELNGFWIGKFEATGTASNPTVLPNEKHIGDTNEYTSGISNVNGEGVGIYYDIAKIVGKEDVNNSGGNGNEFAKPNQHNFQDYSSHVLKNSEWGAATYLASSVYGAGIGEVRNNGNTTDYGAPNYTSYGITGCGPEAIEDTGKSYQDFGTIGEADACGDLDHGYNGKIGVLASTTGNVYGVYDMAGGVYEFVAGVYSENNVNYSDTDLHPFFVDPISEPYADLYRARDFLAPVRDSYGNNNYCTWSTCGGDATYETKNVQSVVSVGLGEGSSWANDSSKFVQPGNTMLMRGGYGNGADDGIYSAHLYPGSFGYTGANYGFRIGLHNLK